MLDVQEHRQLPDLRATGRCISAFFEVCIN